MAFKIDFELDYQKSKGWFHDLDQGLKALATEVPDYLKDDLIFELATEARKLVSLRAPIYGGNYANYPQYDEIGPRKPGTLKAGVESSKRGDEFNVTSEAIDPWTAEDYAPKIEFGWGVEPQPFFEPSIEALEEALIFGGMGDIMEYILEEGKVPKHATLRKILGFDRLEAQAEADGLRNLNEGVAWSQAPNTKDETRDTWAAQFEGRFGHGYITVLKKLNTTVEIMMMIIMTINNKIWQACLKSGYGKKQDFNHRN